MQLNEQQEEAANHRDGPCLVTAVPGSGKTRLLVERVARMVDSGISPKGIVCVTFTNKAADEMKERIAHRLQDPSPQMFIGTFHKMCVKLLRKFGNRLGYSEKFTIADQNDQIDIMLQVARQMDYSLERKEARILSKFVNDWRENVWSQEDFFEKIGENTQWAEISENYLDRIKASNMIDFSGLLSESINLFQSHNDCLERVQTAFKYMQVDEVQDTNYAQFVLINLFSAKWNNVMMVGDLSQSIYAFRGARYQNIRDFMARHDDCRLVELPVNYRSTPQIVKAADTLIKHNATHMGEKFETINPDGEDVKVLPFYDQDKEAEFIALHCRKLSNAGWKPNEIAVLYRMNSMSEPIERALAKYKIPYTVVGGNSFFDRKEIKDCIAMLRFAVNPKDSIAFHRCAKLVKGVGDTTIGKIETLAMHDDIDLLEASREFMKDASKAIGSKVGKVVDNLNIHYESKESVGDILDTLSENFDYASLLEKQYGDESADRMDNVRQMIDSASDFKDSVEYLQTIALVTASDKTAAEDHVSLMSIHASKGLEFPIVFMVGCEDDVLPHSLAISDNPIEGIEEERRLCYVGMTRAKQLLYMTYCRNRRKFAKGGGITKKKKASRFLKQSGLLKDYEMQHN